LRVYPQDSLQALKGKGFMDRMKFFEKLPKLIKERGLTPAVVSRQTGIRAQRFTDWKDPEPKDNRRPTAAQLLALARALKVPMEYLADDAMDDPPPSEISPDEAALLEVVRASGVSARELRTALIREGVRTLVRAGSPGDGYPGDPDIDVEPCRLDPDIDVAAPRPPAPEVGKPVGLTKLSDRIDPPPPRPRKPKR
jgi:transcriptional regulator with XRE-family HTH domain